MRNKYVAAILAYFLGWFGVHKFYLGQTGTGIVYLIFCWTGVPWFLALIDGVILLCTSDRVFNAKYNHRELSASSPQPSFTSSYTPPARESTQEKANALGALKKLYEDNIITAEEYEEKRRKIFDSI